MKPAILAVDDDPDVLKAVERDLRKQYGNRFRVLRAESGSIGLELLKRLKLQKRSYSFIASRSENAT